MAFFVTILKLGGQSIRTMSYSAVFILYTTASGNVNLNVVLRDETVWLTQKAMADLFAVGVPAINKHLKNIFDAGELEERAVISILETTAGRVRSARPSCLHGISERV